MLESNHEIIDKMIECDENYKSIISEACKYIGQHKTYSITNYAVLCDNKLVCFTGSDIIDAINLCDFLDKKFPGKKFYYSDEFLEIT